MATPARPSRLRAWLLEGLTDQTKHRSGHRPEEEPGEGGTSTGQRPHIYFEWTEGNPMANFLRFFLFGQGEVAPVTREVIRAAEPDRNRRPHVHAG
ncbi:MULTISPECIES: hypothetical protein [unclassified Streptomyces]|uniref:hypothetical protein n=1 Tax=unclassified Streptomyces TaxID=2593676 RepID=UPI0034160A8C